MFCITSVDGIMAQVVETSVTVNNNSPISGLVHPDDQTQPTYEMTPGFKFFARPSRKIVNLYILNVRSFLDV